MDLSTIGAWPGKSAPPGSSQRHPAIYHMLDVAAVAERLLEEGATPGALEGPRKQALALLVCLHDLGKLTPSFRDMLLQGHSQSFRHWELTEVLLTGPLDAHLESLVGGTRHVRAELVAAIAGHHGRPSRLVMDDLRRAKRSLGEGEEVAAAFLEALGTLWPDASLEGMSLQQARRLSWWLAGLTSAADWVGSNLEWFPPAAPEKDLASYLEASRSSAKRALAEAGLLPAAVRTERLFDFQLRPAQEICASIELPPGPLLAVIEDETGSGKTEAALILAQRMLQAGKGQGIFFALPTMATADAMFDRAKEVVGKLFERPSLTLAHGRASLSDAYRELVGAEVNGEDAVTCAPWLADGRRKALLAQVGIGTVDQALLGILPTRFAVLRQWGLASKILIIDEVHELGDPYLAQELEALLRFHAAHGGSAILMTATLPLLQRRALLKSFVQGRSLLPVELRDESTPSYPALTLLEQERAVTHAIRSRSSRRGPLRIKRLATAEEAEALLKAAARGGAACLWVRNAVDDAIAAFDALQEAGVEVELLHARFTLFDRRRKETAVRRRFGKEGKGREGRILVATQVVESSLDLDFDVMVSDLAPMAALVQRAGRLWRHMDLRPAAERPVSHPLLHVVAPDPEEVSDPRWLHRVLDRGAYVYPLPDQWRTAKVLFAAGQISLPDDLRSLIQAVHGEEGPPVPEALLKAEIEAEGQDLAARIRGAQNVVKLQEGYRRGGGGLDDTHYPTRLGVLQKTLLLAREDCLGGLQPWAGGEGPRAWMESEVQAAAHRLTSLDLPRQDEAAIRAVTADWPEWKRNSQLLCPVAADGSISAGLSYDPERGLLFR